MMFGVLCTTAAGEEVLVEVDDETAQKAWRQVDDHRRVFYGFADAAGRWLAASGPNAITAVGEVRPLDQWPAEEPKP